MRAAAASVTPLSRLQRTQDSAAVRCLTSPSACFPTRDFDPSLQDWSFVEPLVVGAGGIGCELLHLLALSGFAHLTVIDMDVVELSNLNRQFLFTEANIRQPKSTVAAAAVMQRCPGVTVTPIFGRLEAQPTSFYEGFDVVLLAVDSISARRWINRKVAQMAARVTVPVAATPTKAREPAIASASSSVRYVGDSVIDVAKPIFDTGTEGFEGHCRVVNIQQNKTPCIECEMYLYNDGVTRATVPVCTLESVPRAPEHCVLYAQVKEWPERHHWKRDGHESGGDHTPSDTLGSEEEGDIEDEDVPLDPDNPVHVRWITRRARARQQRFGIGGPLIDDMFTLGVIKNVVPAVGFTNAYVAGQAVTELLKWLTGGAAGLDNFAFYNGATESGIYTDVQQLCAAPMAGSGDVLHRCLVCGPRPIVATNPLSVSPSAFLVDLLAVLVKDDAAARAALQHGAASLFISSSEDSATVEVPLPRAPAEATEHTEAPSLVDLLTSAGHGAFVQAWREGSQMPSVECFGESETRLSALVQWEAAYA